MIFSKKEDRTQYLRALSSSQYKYTIFFAETQIPLTFRNTPANVKMQRFAAASLLRVLYYEVHMEGWHLSVRTRGTVGRMPIDFVMDQKVF